MLLGRNKVLIISPKLLELRVLSQFHTSMTHQDISGMRKPYKGDQETVDIKDFVSREPYGNFTHWFELARKTERIMEPNCMAVATATKSGLPSVRMCLLKEYSERGFVFFTNYRSRKAKEIEENPRAALMFYWEPLNRSVRIEGSVTKVSEEESTEYFQSRPKASQIGACASENQSAVISGRQLLEERKRSLESEFSNHEILPKPDYWGGFLLKPESFEFWQGQTDRLHDRIVFRQPKPNEDVKKDLTEQGEKGWLIERLSS